MRPDIYITIAVMAAVTYAIRVLPLTLIRREIRSPFLRSFLYYVPYVTLSVMAFPAVLYATASPWSALGGMAVAVILAWKNQGLFRITAAACLFVYASEWVIGRFF